jgi:hypothetical protein
MAEPFDIYSDAFKISSNPLGTCVVFGLAPAPFSDASGLPTDLGAVRMSNQQLKITIFALWDNLKQMEASFGGQTEVPEQVTDQLEIPRDIWDSFWAHERG